MDSESGWEIENTRKSKLYNKTFEYTERKQINEWNLPNLTDRLLRIWNWEWIRIRIEWIRKSRVQFDCQCAAGRRFDRPQRRLPISVVEYNQTFTRLVGLVAMTCINHTYLKISRNRNLIFLCQHSKLPKQPNNELTDATDEAIYARSTCSAAYFWNIPLFTSHNEFMIG